MKILKQSASLLFVLLTTFIASAQTDLIRYLPENASAIISFNSSRLKSKMTWEEFTQSKLFGKITEKAPEELKPLLFNTDSLGLDKQPEVLVAIVTDEKNPKNGYGAVFIRMKDANQFSNAIQKLFKNRPAKAIGTNKVLIDQGGVFGWNKDIAVITVGENNNEFRSAKTTKAMTAATENKFKILTDRCIKLLTPKITNSYSKDGRFTTLMKEDGDIRMWSTSSFKPLKNLFGKKTKPINMPPQLKGGIKAAVLNFENGKITWQTKNYLAKPVDSLYRLYPGNKINTDAASRLPEGEVLAYISINYPAALFKSIFEISGVKDLMKDALKNSPVKEQDYAGALKGDLSIAIVKADEFAMDDSVTQNLGGLQLFLTGSIGDKTKFEKLVQSFRNNKDSAAFSNGKAAQFLGGLKKGLQYDDHLFVVSLSPQAASRFITKTSLSGSPQWIQQYTAEPLFVTLDLKSIFTLVMQAKSNTAAQDPAFQDFIKGFDHIVSYGGSYSNDHLNNMLEVQFTDKNENSLKQFIRLFGIAAEAGAQPKTTPDEEMPPPPPKEKN
ncbi:MAG: DUF4836 family protein [Bacteroidetes bacterium]|nr:DUF4836 family protein [Bacteroidota bacterium]